MDEMVACRKCRKRFELTGQSVVFVEQMTGLPRDVEEEEGNL
jgi:hypothetical protein